MTEYAKIRENDEESSFFGRLGQKLYCAINFCWHKAFDAFSFEATRESPKHLCYAKLFRGPLPAAQKKRLGEKKMPLLRRATRPPSHLGSFLKKAPPKT
jgi:hypothetical protein